MVSLRLQRRLAASVLKCGQHRVYLDPNEVSEISMATTRRSIKKLVSDGLVVKRGVHIHSRARARYMADCKRKGRHSGHGKRQGTKNARMPFKILWIRRQRSLRRLLRKYRKNGKIDKNLYHKFYLAAKGNTFKNKRVLVENIHNERNEKERVEKLEQEAAARRQRNAEMRKRRQERKEARQQA
eukprot:NODE_4550_length_649_cov_126.636667_g3895_i0.p1 GENE.NODE_4550_length_649_cov_126.636667_g3895_i0~~NODE_4550_length_649_cov_126.636667_g3895_i0.p1  ORF type:complete len:184 (-),score=6.64 NODE_4550_length_649_cov_126.636667_g3895_i0:57-608(-)